MRSPLLLLALVPACIIVDADATDPPDARPMPFDAAAPDADRPWDPDGPPDPGKFKVCGYIVDTATSEIVRETLRVEFYDALGLVTAQTEEDRPPPLMAASSVDGYYCSITESSDGIASPPNFVAVAVEGYQGNDAYIFTSVATAASANQRVELLAFATPRNSVFAAFESTGAIVPIFIDVDGPDTGVFAGAPVAGVAVTEAGEIYPERDTYFDDALGLERRSIDPAANVTGPNGSAIYVGGGVTPYAGTRAGCAFPARNAGHVPGMIHVTVVEGSCP